MLSNTAILGAGTFASKVLVFLLMPLYTAVLSTGEFGTADLISQTAKLIIPLASVGICDGLFRFVLDAEGEERKRIFSTSLCVLAIGSIGTVGVIQILRFFDVFDGYVLLIALYVCAANFHSACANYLRAQDRTALFAAQGIVNTVLTILLNILLLVVFPMGSMGYVLSVVLADTIVTLGLFFGCKLFRDFSLKRASWVQAKELLKFSIPYIPTTMMWLITSASDRYIVTYYEGSSVNGLYSAAYKLPTLMSLISGVFVEAWQFSSVKDATPEERSDFFGKVYCGYMGIMFMGGACLIALAKPLTSLLLAESYSESWKFVPILTISMIFSALSAFFGSVYFCEKKSVMSMLTAMSGAIINVALNFLLIPSHGAMGAAVATMISYLATFVVRAYDTGHYVKFKQYPARVCVNLILLLGMSFVMLLGVRYWKYLTLFALLAVFIFNSREIVGAIVVLLKKVFLKKSEKN